MHLNSTEGRCIILFLFPTSLNRHFLVIQKNRNTKNEPSWISNKSYHMPFLSLWSLISPWIMFVFVLTFYNKYPKEKVLWAPSLWSSSSWCLWWSNGTSRRKYGGGAQLLTSWLRNKTEKRKGEGWDSPAMLSPHGATWQGTALTRSHLLKVPSCPSSLAGG